MANKISDIAHQCHLEGGNAVLSARHLYQLIEEKDFDDAIICIPPSESRNSGSYIRSEEQNSLKVIPNPANGKVQVILPFCSEGVRITLYDNTGRIVYSLIVSSHVTNIDTKVLPEGLYYCKVIGNNCTFPVQKLIIVH